MTDFKRLSQAIMDGNNNMVKELVKLALDQQEPPKKILDEGLIAGMDVVGARFKNCEMFIPEVLASARAMHAGMEILEPLLIGAEAKPRGVFVIGSVKGDLHDIGKNLVAMMLKGAGWKVIDLGVDVDQEKFIETAFKENADLIGLSALLTTTMANMSTVVQMARSKKCKSKIMIGGAPVSKIFADQIGADAYAPDAATAVEIARNLVLACNISNCSV